MFFAALSNGVTNTWLKMTDELLEGRPPKKRKSSGKKVRLVSFEALDLRTVAAQNAEGTRAAIMADLGGADRLSTLERLQVENAALDAAVLRDLQIRWLKGEDIPIGDMVAVQNCFNRTAAALCTTRRPQDVVTIDAYLSKEDKQ